ncbi:WbqC-like protein family protein [Planctomycetes bacterium K23_9]|uniref:WbqC-like protein family protein n=2 Tax=Stieleria marina TaxID=1930275 RepID=A0A517P2F3_9BACT|nr:WbqC-like protein family protein [Planctomycetes bacterium K23_9]
MRVAIMQPYFLPYLGYFSLIASADRFVVFDPVQYIRRGWINRNRILKPGGSDSQYIAVPVAKHARTTLIRDIQISADTDWKSKIRAQVDHYRAHAPFYGPAREILDDCLRIDTNRIVELNVHCLRVVCDALKLNLDVVAFHDIQPPIETPQHAGQWALHIADRIGAGSYINPAGGRGIFKPNEFSEKGIKLQFMTNSLTPYSQHNGGNFIAGLSILDVLMFNSIDETRSKIVDDSVVTS